MWKKKKETKVCLTCPSGDKSLILRSEVCCEEEIRRSLRHGAQEEPEGEVIIATHFYRFCIQISYLHLLSLRQASKGQTRYSDATGERKYLRVTQISGRLSISSFPLPKNFYFLLHSSNSPKPSFPFLSQRMQQIRLWHLAK